ncbi:UDP-N-acetyl-D-mannosamine dehydrogenase [Alteromonas sp. a30]|uniref:UDP-N-acetyl-D-mannosamine dehydrogenase n=1 Tax=Alteromonas sp. a30 TaxID=2730917 RepID=UPI00227F5B58|nr:UDP-N-acetyl-D-mannosamine dehydrogenase [Alteromonas sp. a30]MCY7294391.1 UDP-N-acetyl-D-mannosamine dehydrogenase [Alteromonas sp. a30]
MFNKISVVGLGYIGLPTAAMFASHEKAVLGIDVNENAVNTINAGQIHIIEPDLDIVVRESVEKGFLRASSTPEPADAFLIAVPTPFKADKQPDLSYIEAACKAIAPVLEKGNVLVLESTSPVGATKQMAYWIAEMRPDLALPDSVNSTEHDIFIAHCPERVLPGHVMRELVENDRVIGGMSRLCAEKARSLYQIFVKGECVLTDTDTAEMAKLTENAFRDTNIAFANELSIICDELNIDVWELISIANRHPRVNILQPGPGVGGHCIAVDPWFIVSKTPELARLITTAREVNSHKPEWTINKIRASLQQKAIDLQVPPNQVKIAFLGAAFKANIDDLRESPALDIIKAFSSDLDSVMVVEPNIDSIQGVEKLADTKLVSLEKAIETADILVLLVEHKEFIAVPVERLIDKTVLDFKGVWRK